ncbi:hypothetical protein [Amycolatopsis alkalitolerans]|uniref:Uncharacterized protein n=1 Tax=Amycolatopsis alkalitolerans TaxID=2547244 RepID=A0A5C4LPI3_9PSEU|nr:hypothetical protein [Amycolatopsis alkalitolerans]TNC19073.1 hypothetical protein FG385_32930 [Amycolatopsis alkalitolerans]
MAGNVLTEKIGPLQTWQYLGIVTIAGLGWYVISSRKKAAGQQTTQSSVTQSQSAADVPQFVIQNQFPVTVPGSSSPSTPTHVYNAQGQDLGEYRYGGDQLSYLKSQIGNYGITQSEYNDVVAAFQQVAAQHGVDYANQQHYSWIGPGNVQTTPQYPLTSNPNQGLQNLP